MIVICAIGLFIHKEQYACSVIFICAEGASHPLCTNLPPIGSSRGQPQIRYQGHRLQAEEDQVCFSERAPQGGHTPTPGQPWEAQVTWHKEDPGCPAHFHSQVTATR